MAALTELQKVVLTAESLAEYWVEQRGGNSVEK
jgi:hypothetical protein